MHNKLGQHLTLLGICSFVFTLVMVGSGAFPPDILPPFLASVVIFLVAGRVLRHDPEKVSPPRPVPRHDFDWPWLAKLLNWTFALLLIGILAVVLAKPVGVTFREAFTYTTAPENFFAGSVP